MQKFALGDREGISKCPTELFDAYSQTLAVPTNGFTCMAALRYPDSIQSSTNRCATSSVKPEASSAEAHEVSMEIETTSPANFASTELTATASGISETSISETRTDTSATSADTEESVVDELQRN